ncbi:MULTISPECIES: hypothetical protein [Sporomusa]|jgi:methyl-accepting chemotaxis protein|uniref:hypothetical protein n=1 Tax=Sporomusa TaxID=2375 RepID=UPI00166D598A|nr:MULTISPECIES: hypothetical protein [Sporomusa]MCM0759868.1 hypothetical protein [Sporomusa sphaeroides DSM 2875]
MQRYRSTGQYQEADSAIEVQQRLSCCFTNDTANSVQLRSPVVGNELQQLAETFQLICKKIGALDSTTPEVIQIVGQITSIAKEIHELTGYEVPTMKKP